MSPIFQYHDRIELIPVRSNTWRMDRTRRSLRRPSNVRVVALMHQAQLVDLMAPLALDAARLSRSAGLPMAGSIMLATARAHGATLWTQDADFKGLPDVRFKPAMPG